jgi:hypothetical protein
MLSLLLVVQNLQGLFNEYNADKIDNVRVTHISRSSGCPANEFLQWHLIFAVYLQVTCCVSRFWRLESRGGFKVAGTFVDPCTTTLPGVFTVYHSTHRHIPED